MSERVAVSRIVHTIHAVGDIRAARELYQNAFGGLVFAENYFPPMDRDAALLYVCDHMIEPMAPRDPAATDKAFAKQYAGIGDSFHSFELAVADGPAASRAFQDGGCATASDFGSFFFVRRETTGGVLLEVCDLKMPNDPYDRPNWDWRVGQGHHAGLLRLDHIACVTTDMDRVIAVFTGIVDGEIIVDERVERLQAARRVVIRLGGTDIAFLQPDDAAEGALSCFLARKQNGIYALVWQIEDEVRARRHFSETLDMRLTQDGCISSGFAIEPEDFLGARHEFVVADPAA